MSIALSQEHPSSAPAGPRQGIIWLASYPKSGNTWFRAFLNCLLHGKDGLEHLKGLGFGISSCRHRFDDHAGMDSSDMTSEEIDLLRPRVYEEMVREAPRLPMFMKCHDAWTWLPDGEPMLSRQATAGAIYLIRNPLDVAVSYAHHNGHEGFDRTIANMASPDDALSASSRRLHSQFRQLMMGWSGHVRSWLESGAPVHLMRYEDMKARPLETFAGAIRFAGLEHSEEEIASALESVRFERLQELEREHGFREKAPKCKAFFRKGRSGSWREELTPEQAQRVIDDHHEIMTKFGYLPLEDFL